MMYFIIALATIVVPSLMLATRFKWKGLNFVYNVTAIISLIVAGIINAYAVYEINLHDQVFTVMIHGIFAKPLFLISGAYLGLYIIYRLMLITWKELQTT